MSLDQVVPIVISSYIKKVFATDYYSGSFDDTRLDGLLLYWDTTYWEKVSGPWQDMATWFDDRSFPKFQHHLPQQLYIFDLTKTTLSRTRLKEMDRIRGQLLLIVQ